MKIPQNVATEICKFVSNHKGNIINDTVNVVDGFTYGGLPVYRREIAAFREEPEEVRIWSTELNDHIYVPTGGIEYHWFKKVVFFTEMQRVPMTD